MTEKFIVIDTETANSLEQPFCYDIGYVVTDRNGKIYESRSFMVAEMFLHYADIMTSAYYAEKLPKYWKEYKEGKRELKSLYTIRRQVFEDIQNYNIKIVYAYNMSFDRNSLNTTSRYITKSALRWFFPYGIEFRCIWNIACQTIMNSRNYVKFCLDNGFVSECGNVQTSAEICYRYLTKQVDFIESHTGLEDVEIETFILAKVYARKKKLNQGINRMCWRIPQAKVKR